MEEASYCAVRRWKASCRVTAGASVAHDFRFGHQMVRIERTHAVGRAKVPLGLRRGARVDGRRSLAVASACAVSRQGAAGPRRPATATIAHSLPRAPSAAAIAWWSVVPASNDKSVVRTGGDDTARVSLHRPGELVAFQLELYSRHVAYEKLELAFGNVGAHGPKPRCDEVKHLGSNPVVTIRRHGVTAGGKMRGLQRMPMFSTST